MENKINFCPHPNLEFFQREARKTLDKYEGLLETVIDIGAHIGCFSLAAVSRGAQKIHAFEPQLDNFQILQKNIKNNNAESFVIPHNVGVYTHDGSFKMRHAGGNSGQHSLEYFKYFPETVTVTCISFVNAIQIFSFIDYLKMDIEGAEWAILNDPAVWPLLQDHVGFFDLELHHFSNGDYFDVSRSHESNLDKLVENFKKFGFKGFDILAQNTYWRNCNAEEARRKAKT